MKEFNKNVLNIRRKRAVIMICAVLLVVSKVANSETFFWEDKKGVHMADDISRVPSKFREKYEKYLKEATSREIQSVITKKAVGETIPESAKNALRALRKLEARCEAGISYKDFAPAVGDAKFEVNLYLQSTEADKNKKLADSVMNIMTHYMEAISMLNYKQGGCTWNDPLITRFFSKYPNANKGDFSCGNETYHINIDTAVSYIFAEASKEIKAAMSIISEGSK